jgi:hypothetical protein
MADDSVPYGQPHPDIRTSDGPRVFQFSLLGLFLIITATALVLAIYFGVGRLVGMSTTEILTQGLSQLLFNVPPLLVWAVGLMVAVRRLKRNRLPARLTVIALGGLMLTTFVLQLVHMVLVHWINSGTISGGAITWSMAAVGVFYAVSNAAFWILVIVAIFVRRPPDKPVIKATVPDGNPFQANM